MINTTRLAIIPLNHGQLIKYLENDFSLETELCLELNERVIAPELREALATDILPDVTASPEDYLFYTLWTVIHRSSRIMIGDICFMGPPDRNGEIELGYGTHPAFRGQGYMSEAVGGLVAWASAQSGVKIISAGTDKDNPASQGVLRNNGFQCCGMKGSQIRWQLVLEKI